MTRGTHRDGPGRTGPFFERTMDRMVAPGATDTTSVRIMARSPYPGAHHVEIRALDRDDERHEARVEPEAPGVTDGTFSLRHPQEVPGGRPLRPGTPYAFRVSHVAREETIGEGRFVTAPEPGSAAASRVVFGIMSCHNPFGDDGALKPAALRCLEIAPRAFEEAGASRLLLMGDQVYGDMPTPLSLFEPAHFARIAPPGRESILDCTRSEVRALYQERHRIFWKAERFRELQAQWANHPILDDHEIVDNFGSAPEHSTERWRAVRGGALDAFHDYQARRVFGERRPPSFHHGFEVGDVAGFVMDLRSQRRRHEDGRIDLYPPSQLAELVRFLGSHRHSRAFVLVLSVPILHVPDWMATLGGKISGEGSDAADRWSYASAQACRDALLEVLARHQRAVPAQRLVLVGGDIHVGAAMCFRWKRESAEALQLVSSAVSNHQGKLQQALAESLPKLRSMKGRRKIYAEAELLDGVDGVDKNPFGGLNIGIVEIEGHGAETSVRLRLVSHDDAPVPAPITVFDSGVR